MALQERYEKQDEIPEALREHYIEQDGVFVLENVVGALGAKQRVKGEFDEYKTQSEERFNQLQAQFDAINQEKAALEEKKEQERINQLKADGKTEELHKIELEKLAGELGKSNALNEEWQTKFNALNEKINQQELGRVASKIAQHIGIAGEDGTIEEIETLLKATGRLKNVDGEIVLFNADGTATSEKTEAFAESLKTEKTYRRLARGTQSQGGLGTGSQTLGGANSKAFKGSTKDKAAYLKNKHKL